MIRNAVIVGSGLAGSTAARLLADEGVAVLVVEGRDHTGGQLRESTLNGVRYEPHGAHIFHTSDQDAWAFVNRYARFNDYRHEVRTVIQGRELAWPPQIGQLALLPEWPTIKQELDGRPDHPRDTNFETWCLDIMGATLYEWFVRPYSVKQWGQDPRTLSAAFAPKRVELRDDGYLPLFRDPRQGYATDGYGALIDGLLDGIEIQAGTPVTCHDIDTFLPDSDTRLLLTAPLDHYMHEEFGPLPWRGVELRSRFVPGVDHVLSCGVVNHPGLDKPYTRRVETKWMSGQEVAGTVVSEEYPGAPHRHYPVDDVESHNRQLARRYSRAAVAARPHSFLAGRLATYTYINMDQAVRQGMNAARRMLESWS